MSNDIKAIRETLKDLADSFTERAIQIREAEPGKSYSVFVRAEACRKAAEELKRLTPVRKEWEGGGGSWFAVCEDCRGTVGEHDAYCRHCGRPLEDE